MPLSPNRVFFGRIEVLQSSERFFFRSLPFPSEGPLEDETTQLKAFAICGPGDMDKPKVAAAFVFSQKDRLDTIFWIYVDQAPSWPRH